MFIVLLGVKFEQQLTRFFKCVKFTQKLATMTDYTMLAKKEKRFDLQSGIMFWRRKT